jgi:hypothetical protein
VFAPFKPQPVQARAQVQAPAIEDDLGNVQMPPALQLSAAQRDLLVENGFVVVPAQTREFYQVYQRLSDSAPIFVTSDSLLHTYHLLFDATMRHSEREFFVPMLTALDLALLQTSLEQAEALEATPWAEAAHRNAAYFAVAVKLLDPSWSIPEEVRERAEADLARIRASEGIAPSAIFPGYEEGEDWSQYVPRGHYTSSEELERYFQAMMWHGRMSFRAASEQETRQAALLTLAFHQTSINSHTAQEMWADIYEATVFFVGRSDDLTPLEYGEALTAAYGDLDALRASDLPDEADFSAFQAAVGELRAPEILGMVITEQADIAASTRGLRFMGQRFVPDAFVFHHLTHSQVRGRGLPRALDFFAAIGSARAEQHLEASGDTSMPGYEESLTMLQETFASYNEQVWSQNLYWAWIHSLRPLLEPVPNGYPRFMQSEAWQDKQLTTALASWTELKRDTILYAKQAYAIGRAAPNMPTLQPKGYVEPVPALYARIAALAQMTMDGLEQRELLSDADRQALADMADIASQLQAIAEKQLEGTPLTEEEYAFIRGYGELLETLTLAASEEADTTDTAAPGNGSLTDQQAAVVADVATDPTSGMVLEQGTGRIFTIYVVAPIEGDLVLTEGGVFSHYEFTQPLNERLTDEAWREMLDAGEAPPLSEWSESFLVAE